MKQLLNQKKESFLKGMSYVLTVEEYNDFRLFIESLNEDEFKQIIQKYNTPITFKDFAYKREELLKLYNIDVRETQFYSQRPVFLDRQKSEEIIKQIRKSHPSDYIQLTRQEDIFLMDLWETENKKNQAIPSDIFFAKTIPLLDCKISVDETEENGQICKYRVVIFDNYKEIVEQTLKDEFSDNKVYYVGALVSEPEVFFVAIAISRGVNKLAGSFGFFDEKDKHKFFNATNGWFSQYFVAMLETWYGIQIAMLHPAVRDVFKLPKIEILHDEKIQANNKKRKRKTKYIRTHVLKIDDIEKITGCKEERKLNRKCLAWYVIGHWRTYTSGKKVFVSPYWKGILRNLKKNTEGDDRERKINISWDVNKH